MGNLRPNVVTLSLKSQSDAAGGGPSSLGRGKITDARQQTS
jgi:hypothetical protein